MLRQPNASERAGITDDVTFKMHCCQTDTHIKNIVNRSVLQVMMHRWHQKLRHCLFVHYYRGAVSKINDMLEYCGFSGLTTDKNLAFFEAI